MSGMTYSGFYCGCRLTITEYWHWTADHRYLYTQAPTRLYRTSYKGFKRAHFRENEIMWNWENLRFDTRKVECAVCMSYSILPLLAILVMFVSSAYTHSCPSAHMLLHINNVYKTHRMWRDSVLLPRPGPGQTSALRPNHHTAPIFAWPNRASTYLRTTYIAHRGLLCVYSCVCMCVCVRAIEISVQAGKLADASVSGGGEC